MLIGTSTQAAPLIPGASTCTFDQTTLHMRAFMLPLALMPLSASALPDLSLTNIGLSNSRFTLGFGSVPQDQLGNALFLFGQLTESGNITETNVTLTLTLNGPTSFSASQSLGDLAPGSPLALDLTFDIPLLAPGNYWATISATSDQSASDPTPSNNSVDRYFTIADYFALDGLSVIPFAEQVVDEMGTGTFEGAEDEFILFSYFEVKEPVDVIGMEAVLAPGSAANSFLIFAVIDSESVFYSDVYNWITASDDILIDQSHIDEAFVSASVPASTLEPGGYFAAAVLYSNGGSDPLYIKDDLTVEQDPYASLIYLSADGSVYSDGNALAVRVIPQATDTTSIRELHTTPMRIAPVPATDHIRLIDHPGQGAVEVSIEDAFGHIVCRMRMNAGDPVDIRSLQAGAYTIRCEGRIGRFVKVVE